MAVAAQMFGTRLAYVVVPIEGSVTREVIFCETKNRDKNGKATMVEFRRKKVQQPGGYMVYFPQGHAIRIKNEDMLRHYQLDGPPRIINMEGLMDPNSPLGKLFRAQDDNARKGAMESLEQQVIQLATAKSGPVMPQKEAE